MGNTNTIHVKEIARVHYNSILSWKKNDVSYIEVDFLALVEENHGFNYKLWHAEDKARRDDKGYEFVYRAKRKIDHYNQQRNNRMEAIDEWLFTQLNPSSSESCPIHTETPGMIIDRLSIIALKVYHMQEQTLRSDIDQSHLMTCQHKLNILLQQQQQLHISLEQLISEISNKTRTFKLYRQLKMYNDPTLNPELYQQEKID